MRLIIGLGNPGPQYERTRHNAGFMLIDRLAQRWSASPFRHRFHSLAAEARFADETCWLLKPQTYMNRSGLAVAEAVRFFQLDLRHLLIIVDDMALPCGRIRLRGEGGPGGHHGLEDIQRALASSAYPRLRIGIDPPDRDPTDYVLSPFSDAQWEKILPALDLAAQAVESWIRFGLEKTMSLYNAPSPPSTSSTSPPSPPAPSEPT